MSNLNARDLATILRFAQGFNNLYGHDGFRANRRVHGALPVDNELNALVVKAVSNPKTYRDFQFALAQLLNDLRGPDSNLVVTEPTDAVREKIGYEPGTVLMTIADKRGAAHAIVNTRQAREHWRKVRLFRLDKNGIRIEYFDVDDILDNQRA